MEGNDLVYKFIYHGSSAELGTPLKCGVQSLEPGVTYETTFYDDMVRIAGHSDVFEVIPSIPIPHVEDASPPKATSAINVPFFGDILTPTAGDDAGN